ncbi:MAG: 23S rRNA (adenine(2503)-C(2))-methyltransferase RlmN [Acidobacteria bacterium]|nr:23S rRNA (adenine(2503)-C(2))-methyltransferase RlmN [Acidobacteriota bacterium]
MQKKELIGLAVPQLESLVASFGEPAYRGRQLYSALYQQRQWDFRQLTPFPLAFRDRLERDCQATLPQVNKKFQSEDGTARYLLRLADGQRIETVLMPERARNTICVSTQAGCPVDCKFCLTGVMGFFRNLTVGEIVGQVLLLVQDNNLALDRRLNLVFMGMGEPLLNYSNVRAAIYLLADPKGIALSPARMTLSTAGVVPGIKRLGQEPLRPKLAVSLNAATDELRNQIMPLNRKWPLAELLRVCREFPLRSGEKLTFEYVLLDGVNDRVEDARRLVRLVRGIRCKVNLIGLNPGPELTFRTPPDARVLHFQQTLFDKGVPAFLRKPRGRDIFAACGQLKLTESQPALANT